MVISSNSRQIKGDRRLVSVDALRGFDMFWIIGGSDIFITFSEASGFRFLRNIPAQFDHSWGQFHFYDLIMPLFLFIVGVVMPIAFKNRISKGGNRKELYAHIIKRVVILYILGLVASGHLLTFDLSKIHLWTDTLHAIAVGYGIGSVLMLELNRKWQIGITAMFLLLYWGIMALFPVPGHGRGIYEPDMNLALWVDNALLGHYQEGAGWTYILTNLTFICSVMLGVFAGYILQSEQHPVKKAGLLALVGIGCVVSGLLWGLWFPIIHHLWTSSLVLFAGGLSYLILSAFYMVIDVWGIKRWSFPFIVIGMNAISVYVATHLFDFSLIGNVFVGGLAEQAGPWKEFIEAVGGLAVVWLILYWMYRTKTFIKI